jgi:uncharacterized repeat protein (TIGR03803 family)
VGRESTLQFSRRTDGAIPFGNVLFDAAGNLYGTTSVGGHSHIGCLAECGTFYELSPRSDGRWHEKVLHRFIDAFGEGAEPRTGPVSDAAGNLYGTTFSGGNNSVAACNTVTNGLGPFGNIALDTAGNLYGTTYQGGENNWGAIFQLMPGSKGWTEHVLYNFVVSGKRFGASPSDGVFIDAAGNLYLTTSQGGNLNDCSPNAGCGTVIKVSVAASLGKNP